MIMIRSRLQLSRPEKQATAVTFRAKGEVGLQVGDEDWPSESGASTHMTPSADGMINYGECNLKLRIDDGLPFTIEGYVDVNFVIRSGNGLVQATLTNIAHVPDLRYNLVSLPTFVKHGHTFDGRIHRY